MVGGLRDVVGGGPDTEKVLFDLLKHLDPHGNTKGEKAETALRTLRGRAMVLVDKHLKRGTWVRVTGQDRHKIIKRWKRKCKYNRMRIQSFERTRFGLPSDKNISR